MSRNILIEYMYTWIYNWFLEWPLGKYFLLLQLISTEFSDKCLSIHMKFFQRINLTTFSNIILFFCCVCVCGWVFVCLLVCMYVHMPVETRGRREASFSIALHLTFFFWDTASNWTWSLLIWRDQLVQKLNWSSCLCFPSSKIAYVY